MPWGGMATMTAFRLHKEKGSHCVQPGSAVQHSQRQSTIAAKFEIRGSAVSVAHHRFDAVR